MLPMRRAGVGAAIAAACAAMGTIAMALGPLRRVGRDAPHVVAIHAGGGVVPANLLRVYVEFSAPMEPGSSAGKIHLVDDAGRELRAALLRLDEGLWSADGRFLTVLFDPGRIKRGLRSNVEMGAPLAAGRRYRLVVDPGWYDAHGRRSTSAYTQELRVAAAARSPLDPRRWSIASPARGSRDELRVDFSEALDYALALRAITVVDSGGSLVTGHAALRDGDRVWSFVPSHRWADRRYSLRIDPGLEDLAGNNLVRPFDADRSRVAGAAPDDWPRFVPVALR